MGLYNNIDAKNDEVSRPFPYTRESFERDHAGFIKCALTRCNVYFNRENKARKGYCHGHRDHIEK